MDTLKSPARELLDLRGAYGRMFTLAARAMQEGGCTRDAVQVAMANRGEHVRLGTVRLARVEAGQRLASARHALAREGLIGPAATELLWKALCEARATVEQEWSCSLPVGLEAPR